MDSDLAKSNSGRHDRPRRRRPSYGSLARGSGFQIIEVLLAVAICAIVIIPLINLLNSVYVGMVKDRNGARFLMADGASDSASGFLSKGKQCLLTEVIERMIEGKEAGAEDIADMFSLDVFTHQELGISAVTAVTGLSFKGLLLTASLDSSSTTDPDLMTVDMGPYVQTGMHHLEPSGFLETGPGIVAHAAVGNALYTANTSSLVQGHGLKMPERLHDGAEGAGGGESESPNQDVVRYVFPGANSHSSPISKRILVANDLVILGTQKSPLSEIHIFTKAGELVSMINTEYGINDMHLHQNGLIVLGPQDPELQVFDLSDPSNPILADELDFPGGSGNGRSVAARGRTAYLGRSKGGNEFLIASIGRGIAEDGGTEFSSGKFIEAEASLKLNASIDRIAASQGGALLFTSNEHGEVYFASAKSKPERFLQSPSPSLTHFKADLPGRVTDYACLGDMIFLSIKSPDYPLAVLRLKLRI